MSRMGNSFPSVFAGVEVVVLTPAEPESAEAGHGGQAGGQQWQLRGRAWPLLPGTAASRHQHQEEPHC